MPVTAPRALFAVLLVLAAACRGAGAPPVAPAGIAGDWTLTELAGQPAPNGYDNRPATLRFENDSTHVSGFLGCNRVQSTYSLSNDLLRFGGWAMTRMSCPDGMELERRVQVALDATRRFQITGTELVLLGESGPVAKFTRSR
jgi:heat shock protein HslJ